MRLAGQSVASCLLQPDLVDDEAVHDHQDDDGDGPRDAQDVLVEAGKCPGPVGVVDGAVVQLYSVSVK